MGRGPLFTQRLTGPETAVSHRSYERRSRWSRAAPSSGSTSSVTPSMATTRTGSPAATGVARFVRARQRADADADDAVGVDGLDDLAELADHPLAPDRRRGEPGADHRRHADDEGERHAADAGEQRDPRRPQRDAGQRLEQPAGCRSTVSTMPTPVQKRGMPTWTSTAKASIAARISADRPARGRQRGQAGAGEHEARRADHAGDADAGGEELEDRAAPGR